MDRRESDRTLLDENEREPFPAASTMCDGTGSDMSGVAPNAVQRPTNQPVTTLGARYGGAVPRPVSLLVGLTDHRACVRSEGVSVSRQQLNSMLHCVVVVDSTVHGR